MSGFHNFVLVYSWFCDRALMLPSCLVFFECARAARSLFCVWLHVGAWRSDPGTPALFRLCSGFRDGGLDTHAPSFILLWEREVSSSLGLCAPLSMSVLFCLARGSVSDACFFVVLFCCTQLVFFHWLRTFMFVMICFQVIVSCFAHGQLFVLLAMCLCFCFVRAHGLSCFFVCAMYSHVHCLLVHPSCNLIIG